MVKRLNNNQLLLDNFGDINNIISINNIPYENINKNKIVKLDIVKYICDKPNCNKINEKQLRTIFRCGAFCNKCNVKTRKNWYSILCDLFSNINRIISINNEPFQNINKNHIKNTDKIEYYCENEFCNEIEIKNIETIEKFGIKCKKCSSCKKNYNKILPEIFTDISNIITINSVEFKNIKINEITIKDIFKYKCSNINCEETNVKSLEQVIKSGSLCKKCTKINSAEKRKSRKDWHKIILDICENINNIISINNVKYSDVIKNKISIYQKIKFKCKNLNCENLNEKTIREFTKIGCFCKECTKINSIKKTLETREKK